MQQYDNKEQLVAEILKTAKLFIDEFDGISDDDKHKMIEGIDKTPMQMIAYQLGWMNLIMSWDKDEKEGIEVVTPSPEYKWNKLGGLYESFYYTYESYSLNELKELFPDFWE
jgi:hypothetical protein